MLAGIKSEGWKGFRKNIVTVTDLENEKTVRDLVHDYPLNSYKELTVEAAAFSPDKKHLITGTNEGRIEIWDLSSDKQLFRSFISDNMINSPFDEYGRLSAPHLTLERYWPIQKIYWTENMIGMKTSSNYYKADTKSIEKLIEEKKHGQNKN